MLRVGIVGAGNIARIHGQCWSQLPVELTGWFDVVPDAAIGSARKWGGTAFSSLPELIDRVDIVDVCTNVTAHTQPVMAAARARKAIVCEKPLARTVAECEAILQVCRDMEVRLFVAHVVRFFPEFAAAHQAVATGAIGTPGMIRTVRAGDFPRRGSTAAAQRYADFAQSGGVVMDVGIHDIDFHRWCLGEIERVYARGLLTANVPACDHALISLRFASGAIGHIEASWAHSPGRTRTHLEIAGTGGLIEWDSRDPGSLAWMTTADDMPQNRTPTTDQDHPYRAELAHFLRCLERDEPFRVSPEDALMAVKVSQATLHSIRTGLPVTVGDFREEA